MASWRAKGHCIDGVPICYHCSIIGSTLCPGGLLKLRVLVQLSVDAWQVEQGFVEVRSDDLKGRGLPYPWDLFFSASLRRAAARESAARGMRISFMDIERSSVTGEHLQHARAAFQCEDVFLDGACTVPYTVSMRVDKVLRGDAVVTDPMELVKQPQLHFTAAFFERLGAERAAVVQYVERQERMEEARALHRERGCMEREDHLAMCEHTNDPYFHRCLLKFGGYDAQLFVQPMSLMKANQFYTRLQMDIRNEFSGYYVRGETNADDYELYYAIADLRLGSFQEKRQAAHDLQAFRDKNAIKAATISDHDYTAEFYDDFLKFTGGAQVPAVRIEAWLDRNAVESYWPDFEKAVEKEYGAWPCTYGVVAWEKSAVSTFSRKFSACTNAVFVDDSDNGNSLEKIYCSVKALAAARRRQRALNARCSHLQEAGATEAELRLVRKRAAMVNQIDGGFRTSADWPDWLRAASGIVPDSSGCCYRPPATEVHAPPCITDCALGIHADDAVEDGGTSDDKDEEPEEFRGHGNKLLKGVPPCFRKLRTAVVREIIQLTKARENKQEAIQAIIGLLPEGAVTEYPRNQSLFLSRIWIHCCDLLCHRKLLDAAGRNHGDESTSITEGS